MGQGHKVAIVTGASRGIGAEIALRLARDGFSVVVNYAGNAVKAQEVVQQIEILGGTALAVQADISAESDVGRLFQTTLDRFGRIDAVVNNAAIFLLSRIELGDVDGFDRVISTNLRGAFLVMGQAARHVASGGRIVVLSSSVIAKAFPTYGAYCASKAGVEALVPVLANELRGRRITVNAVAPGPVATELFLNGKSAEQIEQLSKMPPLERLGQPVDIAAAVSFLLGPDGEWVNAQTLRVNGGFA